MPGVRDIEWRTLRWLDPSELATIEGFLDERRLADGETFSELDLDPPGVLFIRGGWVSVVGRMPNGLVAHPLIVGRGRTFGEGAYRVLDPTLPSVNYQITGLRNAQVSVLPANRLGAAIERVPDLGRALRRLCLLRSAILPFSTALRRSPALNGAGLPSLTGLVMLAELRDYQPGETIVRAGDPADVLYLLAAGEARVKHSEAPAESELEPGVTFGSMISGRKTEQETIVAVEPAACLQISRDTLRDQFAVSPVLRRIAGALTGHTEESQLASIILATGDSRYPVDAIGRLVAATLAQKYNDRVAFIRLIRHDRPPPAPGEHDGVWCESLPVRADTVWPTLRKWRKEHPELEFILLDRGELSWEDVHDLAPHLSKVAYVTSDTFREPPLDWRADKIAWCVQLGDANPRSDPPHQYGTVRVRFNMREIGAAKSLSELSVGDRAGLERWARDLSERTVGVALGGGGAWGFAHVPLLHMLARMDIPVDMVSGASFGSLAGSFYCGLNRPDWADHLVAAAADCNRALQRATLSSGSVQRVIDQKLGEVLGKPPRLEELEIPLLPVATNVGAGAEAVIGYGTVGWGARCSSSFPGIFTPTTGPGFRYVDGGIVRNVPTDPLGWHGCALIIASNIVPNPRYEKERPPRFGGRVGRWLHEFNLFRRVEDAVRSSLILMHTASDAVSWDADVLYNSPMLDFSPTDLTKGPEIIAASTPSVAAMERRIQGAWRTVREGRGSR